MRGNYFLLLFVVRQAYCRREGLFEVSRYCVEDSSLVELRCPHQHTIVVSRTKYYKSKQPGCNLQDGQETCHILSVSQDIFDSCYGLSECDVPVLKPNSSITQDNCTDFSGDAFLEIKYKCEPILTTQRGQLRRLCQDFTFTGSLVYLTNLRFPSPSSDDACSCQVDITNGTYIEFDTLTFEDTVQSAIPVSECPQKLLIWTDTNGGELNEVCSHEDEDPKNHLNIEANTRAIVNLDNVSLRLLTLVLIIQVHYQSDLTITCHDHSTPINISTPASTTTVSTSTDTEGVSTVIVVSVVVVLLVVIILLAIGMLYMRYIRDKDRNEQGKAQTDRFTFENVTYNIPNGVLNASPGVDNVGGATMASIGGTIDSEQTKSNGVSKNRDSLPYHSPLGVTQGRERSNSIILRNAPMNGGPLEKIHIYDHHRNRPVSFPPKPPPGVRLSFRESKSGRESEGAVDPAYEELPDTLPSETVSVIGDPEDMTNSNNSNNIEPESAGNRTLATGEVIVEPVLGAPALPARSRSMQQIDCDASVLSISLHSGLDDCHSIDSVL